MERDFRVDAAAFASRQELEKQYQRQVGPDGLGLIAAVTIGSFFRAETFVNRVVKGATRKLRSKVNPNY